MSDERNKKTPPGPRGKPWGLTLPTDRPERGGVIWSSECRRKFELLDGRPSDYEMRWCPFCGGELVHDRLAGMED